MRRAFKCGAILENGEARKSAAISVMRSYKTLDAVLENGFERRGKTRATRGQLSGRRRFYDGQMVARFVAEME